MHHDAQLRVCHERIGDDPHKKPKHARWAYCDLAAFAWCFDDSMYVCDIHYQANHQTHQTQVVTDETSLSGD
jgi:hypothetical protein